jgi:hypothetical protein
VQTELKVLPVPLVQPVLQALPDLLVQTELKVLLVPLAPLDPLVQLVLLALPEQRMLQSSLVFWPSPTVEPDHLHRILWT